MAAATLLALECRQGTALGHGKKRPEVERRVPAGVVGATPRHADALCARLEGLELPESLLELALGTDQADQALHRLLEVGLDRVRILTADAREGLDQLTRDRVDLACVDRERTAEVLRVERRVEPGTPPENEKVRERVAAETIRAVHPARDLARREEPGHRGGRGVGVDADPAHHVVAGRTDLHRLLGDVHARQLLELVVHGRQPLPDVVSRAARRDVEVDAPVGWNWTNSMSIRSAPAQSASAWPSPVYSHEFDVIFHALPIPPVARTIALALKSTTFPWGRQ